MAASAMSPNHGAVAPHKSVVGTWQWLVPLVGRLNYYASKNRERDRALDLGGPHLVVRHNSQPIVGSSDGKDDG